MFFLPIEVKKTLKEFKAIMKQFDGLCSRIVEPEVIAEIKNVDKTVHSVRVEGKAPDFIALLVITNVVGRHLQCGQYHIYRGLLGMVGEDMVQLWNFTQRQMKVRGYRTEEEIAEDNKWLKDEISRVG